MSELPIFPPMDQFIEETPGWRVGKNSLWIYIYIPIPIIYICIYIRLKGGKILDITAV